MSFSTQTENGHVYVIPGDAAQLVATDRLDWRLFDVTPLVEFGYVDTSRGSLPLIITYAGAARVNAAAAGGTVTHELSSINSPDSLCAGDPAASPQRRKLGVLAAKAIDRDGNTVEYTIVSAYKLAR